MCNDADIKSTTCFTDMNICSMKTCDEIAKRARSSDENKNCLT